jgi:hypothetical protein
MARGTNSLDDCWGSETTPADDAIVESIDLRWAPFTGRRIALAARPRPHTRGLDTMAPRPSAEMDVLTPARSQSVEVAGTWQESVPVVVGTSAAQGPGRGVVVHVPVGQGASELDGRHDEP